MNIIWTTVLTIVTLYAGLCLFALVFSKPMLFPIPKPPYYDASLPGLFKIKIDEKNFISTIYLPSESPDTSYTLLYSHGNAEDIGSILSFLEKYRQNGWNVLIYDYPGYGLSNGAPSEKSIYAAINAVYEHAIHQLNTPAEKIVLYGKSLGGGPSIELAKNQPVAGIMLECTYTGIFKVITHIDLLPWEMFRNLEKIGDVRAPLLIFHGKNDEVVPFSHGISLYEKANMPKRKFWVNNGGHNNLIEIMGKTYWDAIDEFKQNLPPIINHE